MVTGMCFNTTASNTGHKNGACVLIEQKLEKDVMVFPLTCIAEIVSEAIVSPALQTSSGPDIPLFKQLQSNWQNIEQHSFDQLDDYPQ